MQTGHTAWIQTVAFSADGRLVASGGGDGTIKLWDVASGQQVRTINARKGVKIDPSERRKLLNSKDQAVYLFESIDGGVANAIHTLAFSPDGLILASGSTDKTVKLWDSATGTMRKEIQHSERVWLVAFSRDGSKLLTICEDDSRRYWDVASGTELKDAAPATGEFRLPWVGPDGELTARYSEDKRTIELLDSSGVVRRVLEGHQAGVRRAVFSPDGATLASGGWDKTVRLWDVKGSKEPRVLTGSSSFVSSLAFSPDGELLAGVGGDLRIHLWEVRSGKHRAFGSYTSYVQPHAFGLGDSLLVASSDNLLHFWNMDNGQKLGSVKAHKGDIKLVVFSPDKFLLATSDQTVLHFPQFGAGINLLIEHLEPFKDLKKLDAPNPADSDENLCADRNITLVDFRQLKVKTLPGHDAHISVMSFSYDGKWLASGAGDGKVKVWNTETGEERRTITVDAGKPRMYPFIEEASLCRAKKGDKDYKQLTGIAISPDGQTVATYDGKGNLELWDVATGLKAADLPESGEDGMLWLGFGRDGKTLLGLNRQKVCKLWDIAEERLTYSALLNAPDKPDEVLHLIPYMFRQSFATFTRDTRFLARPGTNGSVGIYDTDDDDTLVAWLFSLGRDGWAVVTPDGHFDTDDLEKPAGLNWVSPHAPFTPLALDIFMRDYYEPQLLPRLLNCKRANNCAQEFKQTRDLSKLNWAQPKVEIRQIEPDGPGTVRVTVDVASVSSDMQWDAQGRPMQSGVYDVRLFRDGQVVGSSTPGAALSGHLSDVEGLDQTAGRFEREMASWQHTHRVKLDERGHATITFPRIQLPQAQTAKGVDFSAYSFNSDRIKSGTAHYRYVLPATEVRRKGRAYVITVGVNAHQNPDFNLSYAANDALLMEKVLAKRLADTRQYEEVVTVSLISDWALRGGRKETTRQDATKENIRSVLQLLSKDSRAAPPELRARIPNVGKLRPATPDDLVIIFFSSHGYTGHNGLFYFIPYDTGPGSGNFFTETVRRHSLSSDELSLWLRDVDGGQMTLIVDACHSTAAVKGTEFKPGPMGSRGLGQLSYDKGMRILTATQSDNIALEHNCIRHGLLSYVLLQEGLEENKADYRPADKEILMSEWLKFGEANVPELYERLIKKTSTGDCSVDSKQPRLVPELTRPESQVGSAQRPSLFDFTRRKNDANDAKVSLIR